MRAPRMSRKAKARYQGNKVLADLGLRGWNSSDLARATGLSFPTISRFLHGHVQTPKTAERIARALGYSVRRYFSHVEST